MCPPPSVFALTSTAGGRDKGSGTAGGGGLWFFSGSFCLYFNVAQEVPIHEFLLHLRMCGFAV